MRSDWNTYSLIELAEKIGSGATPRGGKEAYKSEGTPLIRSQNVLDFTFSDSGLAFIDEDQAEKLKNVIVETGDILINITGDSVARVCEAPIAFLPARVNQHVAILRPSERLSNGFLKYYLLAPRNKGELLMLASSGATRNALTKGMLENFQINLPPLPEQKAIAHILGTLDDKIELNRKMNETLEQMAQALFKSWFVDFDPVIDKALAAGNPIPDPLQKRAKLREELPNHQKLIHANPELVEDFPDSFQFTEELGWIPEGWAIKSFDQLLEYVIGGDWGKELPDEKHTEQAKIIRGTDFPSLSNNSKGNTPTRWVEEKKLIKRQLQEGDIIVEVSGGSPTQPTGRSLLITEDILARLGGVVEHASFCRLFRPKILALGYYGFYHMQHIYKKGKMWGYQVQSTGISNFQTSTFLEVEKVCLPDKFSIVKNFSDQVHSFQAKGNNNQNLVLENLRDTLLPKLISGELRVPDAETLVAQHV